jgi:hypothetical protein
MGQWSREVRSEISPHLPVVQPALTNEALGAESQRCSCSIVLRGKAKERASPKTERWQPHS